ncbi:hypothetical protein J4573_15840 [Actinomadura barringtoniae]|uniref:Uncharacterized protein n=1 Tax=Actinomadura barringtoniae TaxID=1427535 RepID=A0A939P9U9_9ACTN|nr:hypothetical protein [Actinomadura barringtoniae]MBO2448575.1 hypothetical protein [Actinomadura barringtoniae]
MSAGTGTGTGTGTASGTGTGAPRTLTSTEFLVFYGITARGTLQQDELFRFMEGTGPQWWLPVSGMTREEFWRSHMHALVARGTTVRILSGGCRPSDKVTVNHVIRHGRRPRPNRDPEYGFVDFLEVVRDADGVVLADLTANTVWVDFGGGTPKVAAQAPDGLDCPLEELPPVDPLPVMTEPLASSTFRWTSRECDVTNDHVSFPSYVERAENAVADAGLTLPERPVWQGWYRYEFACDVRTTIRVCEVEDGLLFGFCNEDERRPRVFVRLSDAGS